MRNVYSLFSHLLLGRTFREVIGQLPCIVIVVTFIDIVIVISIIGTFIIVRLIRFISFINCFVNHLCFNYSINYFGFIDYR